MSDLISREDVLDQYVKICVLCGKKKRNPIMCKACYLDDAICIVEDAPSAEPEKWIPVTEALPEEDIDVLLQFPHTMGVGYQEDGFWNIVTCDDLYSGLDDGEEKPIAWMPLPESYKGD